MRYFFDRLKEPSTLAGLSVLADSGRPAGAAGVRHGAAVGGLAALLAMLLPEKKGV